MVQLYEPSLVVEATMVLISETKLSVEYSSLTLSMSPMGVQMMVREVPIE